MARHPFRANRCSSRSMGPADLGCRCRGQASRYRRRSSANSALASDRRATVATVMGRRSRPWATPADGADSISSPLLHQLAAGGRTNDRFPSAGKALGEQRIGSATALSAARESPGSRGRPPPHRLTRRYSSCCALVCCSAIDQRPACRPRGRMPMLRSMRRQAQ